MFADADARRDLEAIVHPMSRSDRRVVRILRSAAQAVAMADIPLLYETGRDTTSRSDRDGVRSGDSGRDGHGRDGMTERSQRQRIAAHSHRREVLARTMG